MTLLTLMYLSMMLTTCCFTQSTVKQIKENMKSYAKGYVIQYYVPYVKTQPDEDKMKLLKHLDENLLLITGTENKEVVDRKDTLAKSRNIVSRDVEDIIGKKIRSLSAKVESNDGLLVDIKNQMKSVSRDVEESLEDKVRRLSDKADNDGLMIIIQNLMKAVSRDVEESLEDKVRRLSDKADNDGLMSITKDLMKAVSRDVEESLEDKVRRLSDKADNDGLMIIIQDLMKAVSRDVEESLEDKVRRLSDKADNDGLMIIIQNLMKAVSRDVEESLRNATEAIDGQLHKDISDDAQLYTLLKETLLPWLRYNDEHDNIQLHNLDLDNLINWLTLVHNSRRNISTKEESFYQHWNTSLPILSDTFLFADTIKPLSTYVSLSLMGLTDRFMNLYWPFRRDINLMHQRLAVKGFRGTSVSDSDVKEAFFDDFRKVQPIHLPVKKNEIVLVFNDEDIADWLNVTGVLSLSPSYMASKKHIFTGEEQWRISTTAHAALRMINNTHPELFDAMTQMIACISFYKQEHKVNIAGGSRAALGMLWMDPSVGRKWSVPFMAEQIVHEYTHNVLNYAEFVHGTYNDKSTLGKAEVKSAIRLVPRPYDKSLHAAYVSAGLVTFHSRTGYLERAAQLVETLPQAVRDLATVEADKHVLDGSGRAIVKFLTDYMYLTRL
ncbi:uncharacterized protein LOC124148694 [Haliotis rufescens]|uniref:uncharacterized protein LOC124148694 n=1 Tax=Haliotis rufescens TaxID=6454 RepID=UPI00201E9BD4|nr:uncharacterized protein LOC124148694 [Haliotis rufescens]